MSLIEGRPEPSHWAHRMNGAADKIHGFDDGEAEQETRNTPAAPYVMGDEIETLNEIDRLTKINNK
jgi:hypothetical protein